MLLQEGCMYGNVIGVRVWASTEDTFMTTFQMQDSSQEGEWVSWGEPTVWETMQEL